MKYTPNYNYKQPERTVATDDPADINDLADNWGEVDKHLKALSDANATTETVVNAHVANLANPHKTTAAQLGAASIEEVEQRVAIYETHVRSKDNPHDTTAAQLGVYEIGESNALLDGKLSLGGEPDADMVLVTNGDGNAVTAFVTTGELSALGGITGNIQAQLNDISFYNYLAPAPMITLSTGGDSFPEQSFIDSAVIPVIEALHPHSKRRDGVIQNVQTQNGTQRSAFLYGYFDGTQSDGFVGWRYVTQIDTLINLASGTVNGVVRSSEDIEFTSGKGVVNHSAKADLSEAANGLVTISLPSGADLHTLYDVDHNAVYTAGPGNDVANKPEGVDSFVMFSQRASAGHTLHVLYAVNSGEFSSLWTEEWNGLKWSDWRNPIKDLAAGIAPIEVTELNQNPNTWGFPGDLANGVTYPFYFGAGVGGAPYQWGATAGSGLFVRHTAAGDGLVLITRDTDYPSGNPVEIAWRLWSNTGLYYTQYRVMGTNIGSETEPFSTMYLTDSVRVQNSGVTQVVLNMEGVEKPATSAQTDLSFTNIMPSSSTKVQMQLVNTSTTKALVNGDIANKLDIGAFDETSKFKNAYFTGDVSSDTSFTLNGDTITEWPTGGGSRGKKYATIVVGTTLQGHTAEDVDFLCSGVNDEVVINQAINSLPPTGGKVVFLDGDYILSLLPGQNYSISIPYQKVSMQGCGRGTRFNAEGFGEGATNQSIIECSQSECSFSDIYFVNYKYADRSAIRFNSGGNYNIVKSCAFTGVSNPTIYMSTGASINMVRDSYLNGTSGSVGVFIGGTSEGNSIVGNKIFVFGNAIDIAATGRGNIFANNVIYSASLSAILAHAPGYMDIAISGNNIHHCGTGVGITGGTGGVSVIGNTVTSCQYGVAITPDVVHSLVASNALRGNTIAISTVIDASIIVSANLV